jgi:hypothetical protein
MTAPTAAQPQNKRTFLTILAAAILASVMTVGALMAAGISQLIDAVPTPGDIAAALAPEPFQEIGPIVVESIRDLANLTTVEMVEYTVVEKGTDQGWLKWARGDSLRLMAVASIGAGVDLASIDKSSFRLADDGSLAVTVPKAELQYVDVDEDATQILDRQTGLFTKGQPELESEARRVADTVLKQSALDSGILTEAEDNAVRVISNFLKGLGYSEVTVVFER